MRHWPCDVDGQLLLVHALQVLKAPVPTCTTAAYYGYTYKVCTNSTGIVQTDLASNSYFLGSYGGWSTAMKTAMFRGGDRCALSNGWSWPRSALVTYGCGASVSLPFEGFCKF